MGVVTKELFENYYLVSHVVGAQQSGIRLDAFLKHRYRKRSREQLKRAIKNGAITVQRPQTHLTLGSLKPSSPLFADDEVLVRTERKPEPEVCFDYKILFEDEHLFVISKPANLPVHPSGRFFFNTLLVHLKTEGFKNPLKAEREYFLAHRIDKETSGILVLAKNKEAIALVTEQFVKRTTQKRYLAIVKGRMEQDEITIDLALGRKPKSVVRMKMHILPESEGGLTAQTLVRVLARRGDYTLVECFPKTGRQHQIRAHLDAIGHPLVGDKVYGLPDEEALRFFDPTPNPYSEMFSNRRAEEDDDTTNESNSEASEATLDSLPRYTYERYIPPELEAKLMMPRHALHAAGLKFEHPISREMMEFQAPMPADFNEFLSKHPGDPLP